MEALDGNAIAGLLFEHYGTEMTTQQGTCAYCGASGPVAELRVYLSAIGAVARCPSCGQAVMVLTRIRNTLRVTDSSFARR